MPIPPRFPEFPADADSLAVLGGQVLGEGGLRRADVRITAGRIEAVEQGLEARPGEAVLDAAGLWVLPGSIDPQVHFREPGNEHKEDLASGAAAALAGGIAAVMEMPNTKPATTNRAALEDKLARASGRMGCDYAFFVGATAENADELVDLEQISGCAGVKIFMGSSTGDLLVPDDATLERVLRSGTRRVTVHSEDEHILQANYRALPPDTPVTRHPYVRSVEAAVKSTTRLLTLAEKTGRPVHLLHVSTADEIELVRERDLGDLVTVELTPNHLFLAAPECYELHGSWAQMNPPVRDRRHRDALRRAAADGTAACIGSDHAPHTAEEKDRPYPQAPSGIPGVQTTLALLLTAVRDGWLQPADIPRLCNAGPVRVYGIEGKGALEVGFDGDLTLVDPSECGELQDAWLLSRARTNPFVGRGLAGLPVATVVRGRLAHGGSGRPLEGRPLRFASTS